MSYFEIVKCRSMNNVRQSENYPILYTWMFYYIVMIVCDFNRLVCVGFGLERVGVTLNYLVGYP